MRALSAANFNSPATPQEIEEALVTMRRQRHVNTHVLETWEAQNRYVLTLGKLAGLLVTELGAGVRELARSLGVTIEHPLREPAPEPIKAKLVIWIGHWSDDNFVGNEHDGASTDVTLDELARPVFTAVATTERECLQLVKADAFSDWSDLLEDEDADADEWLLRFATFAREEQIRVTERESVYDVFIPDSAKPLTGEPWPEGEATFARIRVRLIRVEL